MIRYLHHHEIDFEKWDDCIERSVNGIFYAYSWVLDTLSPSWDALVADDFSSVMPLPWRSKFGIHYLYQPCFVQQLGLFSRVSLSPELTESFLRAIPEKFRYVDINMNTLNSLDGFNGARLYHMPTYEMDLIAAYDTLRAAYSTNTIRNIKKAEKKGVFVFPGGRPEEVIAAFRNNRGRELQSYSETDYHLLLHLVYAGMHRGMANVYTAYSPENNLCAGAVFYRSHKKVVFLFSGSQACARENGAMFLLIDRFIKDHAGQELVLDFEGSSDKNLARFYSGFGSKECVFLRLKINRLPLLLKCFFRLYLFIRHGVLKSTRKITK